MSESDLPALQTAERAAIRPLNTLHPSKATVESAVAALTDIVHSNPDYASAYANRAQALRLLIGEDVFSAENTALTTTLFSDLARTIELATPASPQDAVSPLQAKTLATAHTHRAYLLMKASKVARERDGTLQGGPEELRSAGSDQLEDMASRDFSFGGRYGDKVAQQMAVTTNPYAKMCGAIVKEAMRQEIEGARPAVNVDTHE